MFIYLPIFRCQSVFFFPLARAYDAMF